MPRTEPNEPHETQAQWFATTQWTTVLTARDPQSTQAAEALEKLCRRYWPPIYAFIRRRGHGPEDAQDLTQEFFARLLEKSYLDAADAAKGRFRTLLLTARWTFRQEGDARDVNFSGDSKHLVSVSRATVASATNRPDIVFIVRLWAVDDRRGLIPVAAATNSSATGLNFCARFSPDAATIAVDDYEALRFLEVPALTLIAQAGQRRPCYARDGRWLLYVEGNRILRSDSPLTPATVLARQTGGVTALALSPDGGVMASCTQNEDYAIKLWDATTGRLIGSLPGHEAWVNDLAFSRDGKTLASAGWDDGWLGIWDVPHRRQRALLRGHNGAVFKVAFAPDGATLATCGDDATVRLWNVAQQREVAVLPAHGGSVKGMAFSPDGHWLASASNDGAIRLWHAPTFAEIEAAEKKKEGNRQ